MNRSWLSRFSVRLFLLAVFSLISAWTLSAQTFFGSIVGTVTDASSAAVPGAAVALTNDATGFITIAPLPGDSVGLGTELDNHGTVVHSGTGDLSISNGVRFVNYAGALYDLQSDGGFEGSGVFNNLGTLRKSGGNGTSAFFFGDTVALQGNGTLDVQTSPGAGTVLTGRLRTRVPEGVR